MATPIVINPLALSPDDLAPGDRRCVGFDWSSYAVTAIDSVDHPEFAAAYDALWAEFGDAGEMETRSVIAGRLAWDEPAVKYELLLLRRQGEFAAVCDHTAVRVGDEVVVHVSHLLIAPHFRGTGLAGWLRAAPLRAARAVTSSGPVTLAMEMEPKDDAHPARLPRLRAAEKAGLRKVADFVFWQPDFRPPADIDAAGGPTPLALSLILRRVGREAENVTEGGELKRITGAIHAVYARSFRAKDVAEAAERTRVDQDKSYPLVPPTA